MESEFRASPLALAVLSLLQAAPLHPYGMQRLLKLWGKDNVINVGQRANLYKTIRRLDQAGLIAVRQTERDQQYPERTVYELTEAGRQVTEEWLTDMLARPRNEYPRFPAALSFIMLLSPAEAADVLSQRADGTARPACRYGCQPRGRRLPAARRADGRRVPARHVRCRAGLDRRRRRGPA